MTERKRALSRQQALPVIWVSAAGGLLLGGESVASAVVVGGLFAAFVVAIYPRRDREVTPAEEPTSSP
jgi:hypothetical protein